MLDLEDKIALWNAINEYAESCGGDTSNRTISHRRMAAVATIEREIRNLLKPREQNPPRNQGLDI